MVRLNCGTKFVKITLQLVFLISVIYLVISWLTNDTSNESVQLKQSNTSYDNLVFTDANSDNITGFGAYIVPNVVYYVVFDNPYMDFIHYLSVKSVLKFQKPEQIVIYCNCNRLRGKYWSQLMNSPSALVFTIRKVAKPKTIFGKRLSSVYHSSDVLRIEILKTLGGIYLDNDVLIVKSLDPFRKFEFSIGWSIGQSIGNQVLIGHKNARFLHLWYESYRHYRPDRWYYSAGHYPTREILSKKPSLVHRVTDEFGVQNLVKMLYIDAYPLWQQRFFAIHLLVRHKSYLVPNDPIVSFNENNIKTYNKTFGQIARLILYDTKDIIVD